MAAMNLDQSLDDMIKETRKTAPRRRAAKSSVRVAVGGKKRASTAKKTARGGSSSGPAPMAIGGVKKGKAGNKKRGNRSAAATAMAVDTVHRGGRGNANAVVGGKTKLMVGNLDFKVTDRDMKELFGQAGRVLKAGINYGPQGKSKGTAEVIMATLESALKAVKTYHGVKLDGRPLSIVIVDAPAQAKPITQRLTGLKQQQPKKNGKNGKNATPAPKRGKATAKAVAAAKKPAPKKKKPARKPKEKKPDGPKPTAADLDASLDAYKASADVQMAA